MQYKMKKKYIASAAALTISAFILGYNAVSLGALLTIVIFAILAALTCAFVLSLQKDMVQEEWKEFEKRFK